MSLLDRTAFLEALAPRDRVVFWDALQEDEQVAIVEALPNDHARKTLLHSLSGPPSAGYAGQHDLRPRRAMEEENEEEEEEEEEADGSEAATDQQYEVQGFYYATTGGGHFVKVETRVPIAQGTAHIQSGAQQQQQQQQQQRQLQQQQPAGVTVAEETLTGGQRLAYDKPHDSAVSAQQMDQGREGADITESGSMDVLASVRALRQQMHSATARPVGRRARHAKAAAALLRNPVAIRHSPQGLARLLNECVCAAPFDFTPTGRPSGLLVTPSRWRRGTRGNAVGGLHDAAGAARRRQQHAGPTPGFGLLAPGGVNVHVRMDPGKPILMPRINHRPHFKPASHGAAGHLERTQMSLAAPQTRCERGAAVGASGFTCENLGVSKHALYRTAQYLGTSRSSERQFLGGAMRLAPLGGS